MWHLIIKTAVTVVVVVLVSEVSKRSSLIGGILLSLPFTSILAMVWLWLDTKNKTRVAELSTSVFWLVIPSLVLFVSLPLLLKRFSFGWAMLLACAATVLAYYAMVALLGVLHVKV